MQDSSRLGGIKIGECRSDHLMIFVERMDVRWPRLSL